MRLTASAPAKTTSGHLPLGARRCVALDLSGMVKDKKDVGHEGVAADSRV